MRMHVFDIGANIGKFTEVYAKKSTTVISVEASPNTFRDLVRNTSSFSNVTCIHAAVSDSSDPTVIFYNTNNTLATLDKEWLTSPKSRFGSPSHAIDEIHVPSITLDKLIELYGEPDFIKVDVEGAEERVLRSLTKKVPVIAFEWAAEWRDTLKRAAVYLDLLGFKNFHVQKCDVYDYWPKEFELTLEQICSVLDTSKDKEDWGMIWAN